MGFYQELIIPKYWYFDYLVKYFTFQMFLLGYLPTLSTIIKPMDRILFQSYLVKIINVFRGSTFLMEVWIVLCQHLDF